MTCRISNLVRKLNVFQNFMCFKQFTGAEGPFKAVIFTVTVIFTVIFLAEIPIFGHFLALQIKLYQKKCFLSS